MNELLAARTRRLFSDPSNPRSLSSRARQRRWAEFTRRFPSLQERRVLDEGELRVPSDYLGDTSERRLPIAAPSFPAQVEPRYVAGSTRRHVDDRGDVIKEPRGRADVQAALPAGTDSVFSHVNLPQARAEQLDRQTQRFADQQENLTAMTEGLSRGPKVDHACPA